MGREGPECSANPKCNNGKGQCRDWCEPWEDQVHGGCSSGCNCCVPKNEALAELEKCIKAGGLFKTKCTLDEEEVAGGCSSVDYCCCAPRDTVEHKSYSMLYRFIVLKRPLQSATTSLHVEVDMVNASPLAIFGNKKPTGAVVDTAMIAELEECVRAGGSFKSKCMETEKVVGRGCSATSDYCCCVAKDVCLGQPSCAGGHGRCREWCSLGEKESPAGCGFHCKCCIPFADACDPDETCEHGTGQCRTWCNSSEKEVAGGCSNNCKCCVPSHDVEAIEKCLNSGGTIKAQCNALEKEVGEGCATASYCCCAPKDVCQTFPACHHGRGYCRDVCNDDEKESYGNCGSSCTCCVPKISEKKVGAGCSSSSKYCCCAPLDPCQNMPLCDHDKGFCRTKCHEHEKESYGNCGLHCKCCVPVIDAAAADRCLKATGSIKRKCSSLEQEAADGCEGYNGYCCCIPKDICLLEPRCDNGAGNCRTSCLAWEAPTTDPCGDKCVCCTVTTTTS
ncbi:balbiani ring protein 3-like [Scylla paramamosain]|uniref:balbiani ring protein 3-like n=1 Tax=Scylla paramamosain TaxID=85552 RepID=UPI0030834D6B